MDPDQGPGAELWGGSGRMARIRESQGEEIACAMAGRPGARTLMEKGSLDGRQGSLERLEKTQGS